MKKKVLQKIQKKVVAFVLAFAMIITGLYILEPAGSVANAASNQTLFAGYYTDNTYETPSATKTDFEKTVSSDVLSVKLQVKKDSTGRYDMRVITTVDDLNYRTVGFDVWFGEAAEAPTENNVIPFETATVLERIKAKGTSVDYKFSPKVVDTESEYFVTGTIKGIHPKYVEVAGSEAPFYIKPFWTTLDGTKVYGESRYFTLQDGLSATNINMSVKADGISGDTVTVAVDGANVTADAVYTADGYAHLNIPVTNKKALKSATKVVVGDLTTYYRNLESSYSGTADTSWYTVCQEAGDTEFVIATSADLYGIASYTATNTVYLVADIEANPDAPSLKGDWEDYIASESPYIWSSNQSFKGTFDGQGHTVTGIYCNNNSGNYKGFLGKIDAGSIVQNLRITNSYYTATARGMAAVVGVAAGTIKNVYADAVIIAASGASSVGGIVGFNFASGATEVVIENCWNNSDIYVSGDYRIGGILGNGFQRGFSIKNCLNTGDIHSQATTKVAYGVGGIVGKAQSTDGSSNVTDDTWAIENCLNLGSITVMTDSTTGSTGGVLGKADRTLSAFSNVYYLSDYASKGVGEDTSGQAYNDSTTAVTTTNITGETAKTTLSGFDFENVWSTTDTIPVLKGFEEYASNATPDGKLVKTIGTLAELQALVTSSSYTKDQKVKLTADIVVNDGDATEWAKGNGSPLSSWTATGRFKGTFDGQGYTISGLYADSTNNYVGLFYEVDHTATIKNLKITNSYLKTTGYGLSPVVGKAAGTYKNIYTDCILKGGSSIGGVVGFNHPNGAESDKTNYKLIIENCWSNSDITTLNTSNGLDKYGAGGILAHSRFGFVIKNCLNTGNIYNASGKRSGGLVGNLYTARTSAYGKDWSIINSLNIGQITTETGSGSFIGAIMGDTYGGNSGADEKLTEVTNAYYLNTSALAAFGRGGVSTCVLATIDELTGDVAKETLQGFDFDKAWTTVEGGVPVLASMKALASNAMPSENLVLIEDRDDFDAFVSAASTSNFFGKTVRLATDIVINDGDAEDWAQGVNTPESWVPIGRFAGTFDGNGHTISGLYINTSDNFVGLFYEVDYTATIKNLKITNSYMKTTGYGLSPVVGKACGTYKNIYTDCILEAGAMVGGIVGYNHPNSVASLTNKSAYRLVIENCWSNSDITTLSESSEVYGAGGILATGRFGFVIKNCLNTGNIYNAAKKRSGGIVGNFYTGKSSDYGKDFAIINCLNLGQIQTEATAGTYAGAIMGTTYSSDLATNNTFTEAENIYYLDTSAEAAFGSGGGVTCVSASDAELTGTAARQTLLGFDFENVWATVEGGTPILKYFAE